MSVTFLRVSLSYKAVVQIRRSKTEDKSSIFSMMAESDFELEDGFLVGDEGLEIAEEIASETDEMELIETLEDTFVEEAEDPIVSDAAGDPSTPPIHAKRSKRTKKLPSKWIVYLGEQRKAVIDANPGVSFADITKMIAEQYKALPAEELERIQAVIDKEKARREEAGDADDANDEEKPKPEQSLHALVLPLARIKRLMKMDDNVKIISKEAIAVTTKATELFIARFALKCASTASLRGGRTVGINDVLHTIHGQSQFEFLDLDFPKPTPVERKASSKPANPNKIPFKRVKEAGSATAKVEVSNGKYSMLNFVSGSKRPAAADRDDQDEAGQEMQVAEDLNQDAAGDYAEQNEDEQGEEGIAAVDEDEEEHEDEEAEELKATSTTAKPEAIVNSLMDW